MDRKALSPASKRNKTARAILVTASALCVSVAVVAANHIPNLLAYLDPSGAVQTFNQTGALNTASPFFQDLGTNDRTCATCHVASDGWTVTPAHILARFNATQGMDPIFRPVD